MVLGKCYTSLCVLFSQQRFSPMDRVGKVLLYLNRSINTAVKNTPVKVKVQIQLIYSSKSKKVPALKCTQSKKVKMSSFEDVSIFVQS